MCGSDVSRISVFFVFCDQWTLRLKWPFLLYFLPILITLPHRFWGSISDTRCAINQSSSWQVKLSWHNTVYHWSGLSWPVRLQSWLLYCAGSRPVSYGLSLGHWFSNWGPGTPRGPWGSSKINDIWEPTRPLWVCNSESVQMEPNGP